MLHSISVDVEEYFHANNLEPVAPPARWCRLPRRSADSTYHLLDLFDRHRTKATFFVLGYVARRSPQLVREIAARGHEIASHGYAHRLAYTQTPKQFLRDVVRARRLLEDLSGTPVVGYRAPSFSIRSDNDWAYDALVQAGYVYDSSLFPIRHPRYGNREQGTGPRRIRRAAGELFLLPLAVGTRRVLGREIRLPAAGGAYWRLLPLCYNLWVLRGIQRQSQQGFHCYFHPWECDAGQPVFSELSFLTKLRHYGGIKKFESRIERFLQEFTFEPLKAAAQDVFGEDFTQAIHRRLQQ
jgi:polysaccharide deacetylase family protein (PEP-CTERM system associated)